MPSGSDVHEATLLHKPVGLLKRLGLEIMVVSNLHIYVD